MATSGASSRGISVRVAGIAVVMAVIIVAGLVWVGRSVSGYGADGVAERGQADTLVLGDSITLLAAEEIGAATGAHVVAFNGAKWADVGPAVDRTFAERESPPRRVGVLLGANDVLALQVESADFDAVLGRMEDVPCVVVMEVPKTFLGLHRQLNALMRAAVARYPNATTDNQWAVLANRNLEQGDGSWFADDIHPNDLGRRELAAAYASALDRHCGSTPG